MTHSTSAVSSTTVATASSITTGASLITVGLDVGDKRTHWCALDADRKVIARGSFPTTREDLEQALAPFQGAKVVLEAGSQSPWMSRVLRALAYAVQVADPRRVQLISKDPRKTDRRDAELLARMASAMPDVLGSVYHRGEHAHAHLAIIRARDLVVRMRTKAVQLSRGVCKAFGLRLPKCSTGGFPARVHEMIPELLRPALSPIVDLVVDLTRRIRAFDRDLAKVAKDHYPEARHLQQVDGVGPVISVAFVLSVEDPHRFSSSRRVGSWLGLCPRVQSSGDSNPQLRISKAGDPRLRRLLVQGAKRIIGPFGADCDLRRYGLRLATRGGGKLAKKKAAIAVARKLAVLLHRLWVSGKDYEALHNSNRLAAGTTS
jgi:transposase